MSDFCQIEDWRLFAGSGRPFIIAGPCSVESREQIMAAAESISNAGVKVLRGGLWKPRTHPGSFEGLGETGAPWLSEAGAANGMKTATEVANTRHVETVLRCGIDAVWIGARTTGNPFLVQEIADALKGTGLPVFVKNPLVPDPELWTGAIERFLGCGCRCVCAVHRGFHSYGESTYRNAPFWQIPVELRRRLPGLPLFCDPSHITGRRDLVEDIARQALILGFDGLMIEVHPDPDNALSDAAQQITPGTLATMLSRQKTRSASTIDAGASAAIDDLRTGIDRIDAALVDLLAERMSISESIGRIKERSGLTVLQTGRWNTVLERVRAMAKEKDLDEDFITEIFTTIHRASMERQLKK
ncbi:MAG TPA: bifunctional 3-deoxy-7-phosphoheptulonate synthase/chorismate mutase type II [Candidatus Coprenecus stercoravium]|uniref:chorismate mutase n=1 Tax=Candidatus Coprenecus stercoravium TaxID=2840735 RepID=A0A9D2K8N1_9BACT|nr:bifunctional 3-deoxy-7-phosphoheptulonate synthase/chorismate mutase type II [Candidatus Coprenecus stercoravium]